MLNERARREALNACQNGTITDTIRREWEKELAGLGRRGDTTGFHLDTRGTGALETQRGPPKTDQRFLAQVLREGPGDYTRIRAFDCIQVGRTVEIMAFT